MITQRDNTTLGMPYTAAPAAVQTSASRACRKWLWRESACLRLLLECTCRSKPPWATSQNRETSPVCSPKRLQKASRNWLYQRKLMPTGPFWRRRLLVQITSRSLHRHSVQPHAVESSKVTYARTASKWHLFGETAHFIPSPRCSVCLDTVQLVRTCLERWWKPRL